MQEVHRLRFRSSETEGAIELAQEDAHTSLCELLVRTGIYLNTRCGMRGLCRGCEVSLEDGSVMIGDERITAPGTIRSCRALVASPEVTIRVPPRSLAGHRPIAISEFEILVPFAQEPTFPGTAGDVALAADIGTTTVAMIAVDICDGRILAEAGDFNRQIRFGDNVVTRIHRAGESPEMLARLQACVSAETLRPLALQVCTKAGTRLASVRGMTVAGNTAMLHLLAGEDPSPLGVAPFRARFLEPRRFTAAALGIDAADWPVQFLPGLAAYVGADLAAGIHATGMHFAEKPTLLVDVGTNGEIILKTRDGLFGCATAAGPAFEGGMLSSGMRAVPGAICHVRMSDDPFRIESRTINGLPPQGICGTGALDFLAEGRRIGLLGHAGRFDEAFLGRVPKDVLRDGEGGRALSLGRSADREITMSEVDIAHLLQAKAAIGAGIRTLMERVGLAPTDISRVLLAGGFGRHIDPANAIRSGLLPGFRAEQIEAVGNTSLAGAYIALLDRSAVAEMDEIRASIDIVELNLDPGFEDRFIDELALP
ncbi:MAG TPA: ASKHA domain-containing protein [Verrucomicrobiae bacterium]|nr:ASKHA domain-containing protein [Verrucomicrobiae bacterium]